MTKLTHLTEEQRSVCRIGRQQSELLQSVLIAANSSCWALLSISLKNSCVICAEIKLLKQFYCISQKQLWTHRCLRSIFLSETVIFAKLLFQKSAYWAPEKWRTGSLYNKIPIFIFVAFALASYEAVLWIRNYFFRILIRRSVIHNYA